MRTPKILKGIVVLVCMTSCTKKYHCDCTGSEGRITVHAKSLDSAEEICDEREYSNEYGGSGDCFIRN